MDWKYYIPHGWESDREVWEDVFLRPVDESYRGPTLLVTVDAFGDATNPHHGSQRAEFQAEALERLAGKPYDIQGPSMLVANVDFSKVELVDWVRIWLREQGLPVGNLIAASLEEFMAWPGGPPQAEVIRHLVKSYPKAEAEPTGEE